LSSYAMNGFLLERGSASLGYLRLLYMNQQQNAGASTDRYPYGLPTNSVYYYDNDVVYEGVRQVIAGVSREERPFFAYIHLMSPHDPYAPTKEFVDTLENVKFSTKKIHPLNAHVRPPELLKKRKQYDEYIANIDSEIGKLMDDLAQAGTLDNTYVFIVSDHGELFERGVLGHTTPLIYEPVIRIPLLVFAPGQTTRTDIHASTSNVDILPTILSLTGHPIPEGVEGRVLPGLGGQEAKDRAIFSVEAKESSAFGPLYRASISMVVGAKKIIYYKGYKEYPDTFELYDLQEDPDENLDIFATDTVTAARMKEELLANLNRADQPYIHK
jgi:choline-sulfatase